MVYYKELIDYVNILDGVIQSHPNATEANIFDEMSRFLMYAPGRIGGGGRGKESW